MKKKFLSILLCLLLVLPFAGNASANDVKVIDEAGLFTADEMAALEQKADDLVSTYDMDVVILTVYSLDGKTAEAYADDYFDYNGYGIGDDYSGVLFLLSMEYRDWYMSTCGDAIYALTDYGIERVFSEMSGDLSNGNYYEAFDTYLDTLPTYFDAFKSGSPIDGYAGSYDGPGSYQPGTAEEHVYYEEDGGLTVGKVLVRLLKMFLYNLPFGVIVALVVVLIMRSKMNTAKAQRNAASYLKDGTYNLHVQRDMFLYSNVSRRRKQQNNGGGGGGSHRSGGGSSSHRSSSGRSHGGGGGKF